VDGDVSDTNPEVLREGHVTDVEASMVGNLSHTIPMKVKIGQTTRWNEAIRELLLGSHPQTD
jgi:LacI family sucrose operon transcriptional repressor